MAAVATKLAAFIVLRDTAAALVRNTHREATLPFQAEKLALLDAATDEIVKIDAAVGAQESNKHAVCNVAAQVFVRRHD